jgi:hypothetical protein
MQYMLLIYNDEKNWQKIPEAEQGRLFQAYMEFTAAIRESGHHVAGDALQPVSTATTVRRKEGKTITTDGPFAETKEQFGGYYLVQAKDLDEALAIAARIPELEAGGSVEVRPVMEIPG